MQINFNNFSKFYKKKKIFITGNTGFVGSYLSMTLSIMGATVLGYSLKKKKTIFLTKQNIKKK